MKSSKGLLITLTALTLMSPMALTACSDSYDSETTIDRDVDLDGDREVEVDRDRDLDGSVDTKIETEQ